MARNTNKGEWYAGECSGFSFPYCHSEIFDDTVFMNSVWGSPDYQDYALGKRGEIHCATLEFKIAGRTFYGCAERFVPDGMHPCPIARLTKDIKCPECGEVSRCSLPLSEEVPRNWVKHGSRPNAAKCYKFIDTEGDDRERRQYRMAEWRCITEWDGKLVERVDD